MRSLLPALVAAALWFSTGCGDAPAPGMPERQTGGPPSILLISLDTTRADRLGCYGHPSARTPHLDALAAGGVLFENAATPAPITLPAHASLMTGLLPNRHGIRDNGLHRLPHGIPTLAGILADRGYDTAAVVAAEVLDRQYGLDAGFAHYDDRVGAAGALAIPERNAAQVTDAALEAATRTSAPFLLFVHYFDPHADYRPPAPFSESFRDRPYDGEIAFMDRELGRLIAGLRQRGMMEDTIVAVIADHGESLGEHGEPTHGVMLYQPTIRIPMILAAPGRLPAGRRVSTFARLTDLLPTLLELAGVPAVPDLDGRSLAATALGAREEPARPSWLLLESDLGYNSYGWAPLRGLTDGTTKWIKAPRPELYDSVADPGERDDLIDRQPERALELARLWAALSTEDRRAPPPGRDDPEEESERLKRLASLGYVSRSAPPAAAGESLPDPKDVIGTLDEINEARRLMSGGRPSEAAALLEPICKASPRNLSALILLGSSQIEAGRPERAVAPLRSAARLAPHHADVHFNLGIALMTTGDMRGAESAWRDALSAAPRSLQTAANLVDLLQRSGQPADAQAVLEQARRNGLDDPVIDYLEGRLALDLGDRETARRLLSRALGGTLPPALAADARALLQRLPS